ncbi:Palmitoyltransferase ZDHHC13 [Microtus ochrogaster]|uniref:Palmitoyltransferase ZDHHC13 n=1 Tax=Microtus ochrogaster TaxID=79684 RepID=A0A8J6FXY8_MICOH|nr:Palmitoyltransferase ZDHHC13 [Microtus ochrogaster]
MSGVQSKAARLQKEHKEKFLADTEREMASSEDLKYNHVSAAMMKKFNALMEMQDMMFVEMRESLKNDLKEMLVKHTPPEVKSLQESAQQEGNESASEKVEEGSSETDEDTENLSVKSEEKSQLSRKQDKKQPDSSRGVKPSPERMGEARHHEDDGMLTAVQKQRELQWAKLAIEEISRPHRFASIATEERLERRKVFNQEDNMLESGGIIVHSEGGDWLGVADWQRGDARSYGGGARSGSEREAARRAGGQSRSRHSAEEPLRGGRRASGVMEGPGLGSQVSAAWPGGDGGGYPSGGQVRWLREGGGARCCLSSAVAAKRGRPRLPLPFGCRASRTGPWVDWEREGFRNHSHGSHLPGFGRHNICAHENQELAKAKEILPLIEDSSNCDIVKATQYGIFERCKELVEAGYDVRQPDRENVSLLHWAAINNRLELVKFYISKGAVIDQLGGDLNSTPLHWAIRPEPTGFLLKFNPSLSVVDKTHQNTALHWAVASGNVSAVDKLLEAGSSLDIQNAKLFLLLILSVVTLWAVGYILDFNSDSWLLKGCLLVALFFLTSLFPSLGFTQNLADFFQCGCFGLVKPCMIDWTSQYTMVFHPAKEKVLRSV